MDLSENKSYLDMELLRFTTAGSVDDGKSTLIGRLLYDSKAIFQDQMDAIEEASKRKGEDGVNLALLTDGLRAEREQGITIDVAYRYFATPKRKFIIADTPGHIQYTRNMVTGASTANVALILVDARNGVVEQTLRHSFIASLLRIPHVILCINKMDLVDFKQHVFNEIKNHFASFENRLNMTDIHFIPISAKLGDNVVDGSGNMDWYRGPTLMQLLENIEIKNDNNLLAARFPVQYIIRPMNDEFHDFRGYAGRVASGSFKSGDPVTVLPSGLNSVIKSIHLGDKQLDRVYPPQSVTVTLENDIDISRGNMLVKADNLPHIGQELDLMVCWLNAKPLQIKGKYWIKHTSNDVRCIVNEVIYKVNINTLEENYKDDQPLCLNEIAKIRIKTTKPLFFDAYIENRITGSLIIIDESTNETVGAGMII